MFKICIFSFQKKNPNKHPQNYIFQYTFFSNFFHMTNTDLLDVQSSLK
jgi:hypothetical protein